jgi:hypothetical protein
LTRVIAAPVALLLSLAFLWGSMRTAGLSRVPGAYTDSVQAWAYFQLLLSGTFGAAALVALLKALYPASKAVAVLAGLAAALASVVSIYGVLGAIAILTGWVSAYQGLAVLILLVVAAISGALYWWIVHRAGVGVAGSLPGLLVALTFAPLFFIGAFVFCAVFTPHIRCF